MEKQPAPFGFAKLMVRLAMFATVIGFGYTVWRVMTTPLPEPAEGEGEVKVMLASEFPDYVVKLKGELAVAQIRIDQLEARIAELEAELEQDRPKSPVVEGAPASLPLE